MKNHEPTPEFLAHLEWQTRTALRRESRFARPTRGALGSAGGGALRAAALVLVSLFAGGGVVIAAERLQESRDVRLLLERARVELRLAERHAEAMEEAVARVQLLFESGMASRAELDRPRAEAELRSLARDLAALDVQEIEAARRPVRTELSAPRVGARDFVAERLQRRFEHAALERNRKREALERGRVLMQSGMVSSTEVGRLELDLDAAERDLARLEERLALRARFVSGALSALECERLDRVDDARARAARLEAQRMFVAEKVRRAELLEEAGRAASGSSQRLRLELAEIEAGLELVALELEALEESANEPEREDR